jgi:ADP-ribose pyrophosphatase
MSEKQPRLVRKDTIYEGRKLRLEIHQIEEPGGRRAVREVIRHNGSVGILAFRCGASGRREVLLERNYRYSVGRYITEIPAGTLDKPGESLEECARRELEEETGCRAGRVRQLVALLPSPGFLSERLTIFVAEDVSEGQAAPEPGELIAVLWVPWDETLNMVRRGEIEDAKTIAAVLYYELFGATL